MQFAEAQLFGRVGKRCIRALTEAAEGRLGGGDLLFLGLFMISLQQSRREISCSTSEALRIFMHVTKEILLRGVVESEALQFRLAECGDTSPCHLMPVFEECLEKFKRNRYIIFEAETLAAVVALSAWHTRIKFKRCLLYVDNEGTIFSLIKGYADNPTVDKLSQVFAAVESEAHTLIFGFHVLHPSAMWRMSLPEVIATEC